MRTGLALSLGIMGIALLVTAIILITIWKIRTPKTIPQNKSVICFLGNLYLIIALICFVGAGLGFMEVCPIPMLWVINFIPAAASLSVIYVIIKKAKHTI